jgi:hypothetical protein
VRVSGEELLAVARHDVEKTVLVPDPEEPLGRELANPEVVIRHARHQPALRVAYRSPPVLGHILERKQVQEILSVHSDRH